MSEPENQLPAMADLAELAMLRAFLVAEHPSFIRIDEIFIELLTDDSVSAKTFDLCCEAVFVALAAYSEEKRKNHEASSDAPG